MSVGGKVRGIRPGRIAVRNERDFFTDPEREAKVLMYQQRAAANLPLFEQEGDVRDDPGKKSPRSTKQC